MDPAGTGDSSDRGGPQPGSDSVGAPRDGDMRETGEMSAPPSGSSPHPMSRRAALRALAGAIVAAAAGALGVVLSRSPAHPTRNSGVVLRPDQIPASSRVQDALVPNGRHALNSPIRLSPGQRLAGEFRSDLRPVPFAYGHVYEVRAGSQLAWDRSAFGLIGGSNVAITDLDLSGTQAVPTLVNSGFAIAGLRSCSILRCHIHDVPVTGIGGCSGLIQDCELIGIRTTPGHGGTAAAIKTTQELTIRRCYIHDCEALGVWWDCRAPGGLLEYSLLSDIQQRCAEAEISGYPRGFTWRHNEFRRSLPVTGPALVIKGSRDCSIYGNTFSGWTDDCAIAVLHDLRPLGGFGAGSCRGSWRPSGISIHDNDFRGAALCVPSDITLGGRDSGAQVEIWDNHNYTLRRA